MMYYDQPQPDLRGMSGAPIAVVPGINPETQRLVILGSLALVGLSVGVYLLTRPKRAKEPKNAN